MTVNGQVLSSTNASLTVDEQNGSYTYTLPSTLSGGPGVRYLASLSAGTITVGTSAVEVSLSYVAQFQLSSSAGPTGAGTVYPGRQLVHAGESVTLSALASSGSNSNHGRAAGPARIRERRIR